VPGKEYFPLLPEASAPSGESTAQLLCKLMGRSRELLANHPVNLTRKSLGKEPANSIWPWSPGYKPAMKSLKELFGIQRGAVISAVDLIQGIGVYAGLDVIKVEGATGLYNTNYEGKATAALEALGDHDFVYLHVEASDEAGHEGDYELKKRTIEYLDERILKTLMNACAQMEEPVTIAMLPDHPTPWKLRTHTRDAVPFTIYNPAFESDHVEKYDEDSAKQGSYGELSGKQFMEELLRK
jgi:2,3-bisphosphoglycerate-independent phosphoglycerate mutase